MVLITLERSLYIVLEGAWWYKTDSQLTTFILWALDRELIIILPIINDYDITLHILHGCLLVTFNDCCRAYQATEIFNTSLNYEHLFSTKGTSMCAHVFMVFDLVLDTLLSSTAGQIKLEFVWCWYKYKSSTTIWNNAIPAVKKLTVHSR